VSPYVELDSASEVLFRKLWVRGGCRQGLGIVKNARLNEGQFRYGFYTLQGGLCEAKGAIDGIFSNLPRWPNVRCIAPLEKDFGIPGGI